jgi:anti-sigma factor RsiW
MECPELRENLVAYLDQELSDACVARVEAHLSLCSRCAEEARLFTRTWDMLESYQAVQPPAGFMESFMRRLAREEEGTPVIHLGWHRRVLPYLAAAALLGVALWLGSQWIGQSGPAATHPTAQLTVEEEAIVQDLPILASERFTLLRDLPLVENYPVLSNLSESDFEAL